MSEITLEELKQRLNYDPDTGIFTWKTAFSNRIKVGQEAGHMKNNGYRSVNFRGKNYLTHRLAWFYYYGKMPEKDLDHINRNRMDNRITNLREASHKENNYNRIGKGYTFFKRDGTWKAQIQVDGSNKHLGYFETPQEAEAAYLSAKAQYHPTWSNNV